MQCDLPNNIAICINDMTLAGGCAEQQPAIIRGPGNICELHVQLLAPYSVACTVNTHEQVFIIARQLLA